MTTNPLLDLSGLPQFATIQPEHVKPAMQQLITEYQALIDQLTKPEAAAPASWADFMAPMTDMGEKMSRAWGVVGHLHSVNDIPVWRDAYNEMLPEVSGFFASLGQNLALFDKIKALAASPEYVTLNTAQKRIVDNDLRDFRLSGAELPDDKKPRFKAIQEELSALSAKFSENLLDATNAFGEYVTDEADLAGLPADVIAAAKAAADKDGKPGWKFSLQAPSYIPVLQYADKRSLRETIYRAQTTRASELGKADWDNTPIIQQILTLRAEEAALLGYNNYAEISLVPKMANSPAQVIDFLQDMAIKAKPFGVKDAAARIEFAKELGLEKLEMWDSLYVSEKLREARYAFSEQEVKQYFPEPKVLQGLFRVIESVFSVSIAPDEAPVWHPDVRFFKLSRDGKLIGQFYLDLYARETKRGGAWMDDAITRRRVSSGIQTPVAYLNCNFPAPVGDKPATFSHDDVITLFHETGHGLHHLLTQVEEYSVSGIHGVEWDAVELPSQFMENFCWEWDVLQGMTAHADTGEPLPRALYDKMLAAKNFEAGLQTLRQLEFSLFDLRLHSEFNPAGSKTVLQLLDEVRADVAVVIPPAFARFPHSFSHIFAGGYAAGYYSYKWAEVLSADAYSAFEEAAKTAGTTLDPVTGSRFLKEILAVGGSRPAIESFTAFRGRAPSPDALLRHSGMIAA